MRRFHAPRFVPAILLLLLVGSAWAGHRTTGSVHVHGYTTRSGHYVAPYTRSAPHDAPALPGEPHPSARTTSLTSHLSTRAAVGVTRDSHGRIERSETAKRDFEATIHAPRPGRPRVHVPATSLTTSCRSSEAGLTIRATCNGRPRRPRRRRIGGSSGPPLPTVSRRLSPSRMNCRRTT